LWFAEQAGDAIGRITTTGVVTEFTAGITRPGAAPFGIATGPDGNLWFTEITGNRIGSITSGSPNDFIFVDGFDGP
jgi:virginiamycin B lyase